MPPYWDNKSLPTPSLTLPDTLFSPFYYFINLLKINAFPMPYEIWKGRKLKSAKGRFELGSIVSKCMHFTIYTTETDVKWACFCSVDYPNHTLVGGVSVNSLCQQGGLFALSVNRHSISGNPKAVFTIL